VCVCVGLLEVRALLLEAGHGSEDGGWKKAETRPCRKRQRAER
jgi:hypothetical protein